MTYAAATGYGNNGDDCSVGHGRSFSSRLAGTVAGTPAGRPMKKTLDRGKLSLRRVARDPLSEEMLQAEVRAASERKEREQREAEQQQQQLSLGKNGRRRRRVCWKSDDVALMAMEPVVQAELDAIVAEMSFCTRMADEAIDGAVEGEGRSEEARDTGGGCRDCGGPGNNEGTQPPDDVPQSTGQSDHCREEGATCATEGDEQGGAGVRTRWLWSPGGNGWRSTLYDDQAVRMMAVRRQMPSSRSLNTAGAHSERVGRSVAGSHSEREGGPVTGSHSERQIGPVTGSHSERQRGPVMGSHSERQIGPVTGSHSERQRGPVTGSHSEGRGRGGVESQWRRRYFGSLQGSVDGSDGSSGSEDSGSEASPAEGTTGMVVDRTVDDPNILMRRLLHRGRVRAGSVGSSPRHGPDSWTPRPPHPERRNPMSRFSRETGDFAALGSGAGADASRLSGHEVAEQAGDAPLEHKQPVLPLPHRRMPTRTRARLSRTLSADEEEVDLAATADTSEQQIAGSRPTQQGPAGPRDGPSNDYMNRRIRLSRSLSDDEHIDSG